MICLIICSVRSFYSSKLPSYNILYIANHSVWIYFKAFLFRLPNLLYLPPSHLSLIRLWSACFSAAFPHVLAQHHNRLFCNHALSQFSSSDLTNFRRIWIKQPNGAGWDGAHHCHISYYPVIKKSMKWSRNRWMALRPRLPCSYMNHTSF